MGIGTGLGLATVDGIVAQSGGHIQVESLLGKSTTIRILLPLTSEPVPVAPTGAPRSRGQSRGRILVVDDEEAVRAVVGRMLQAEGYEVLRAREGREALRELEEVGGGVDLVIANVVMPGMGGRVLGQELARRYPGLPLVWISGHPREVEFPRGTPGQEHPFMMKPISPEALIDTIARALVKRQDQSGGGGRSGRSGRSGRACPEPSEGSGWGRA